MRLCSCREEARLVIQTGVLGGLAKESDLADLEWVADGISSRAPIEIQASSIPGSESCGMMQVLS